MQPASRDSFTGLLSWRAFETTIVGALNDYAEDGGIVAVILADLDGFKRVNDRFGHMVGDKALKSVGAVLQAVARDEGVVCRYGGDEFIVLCTDTTVPRAQQLAVRLKAKIGSLVVNWEGKNIGPLSMSTGLAYCPRDGRRAVDLIHAADVAMQRGDDDPPTTPMAVVKGGPKPSPPTDARAKLQDNAG